MTKDRVLTQSDFDSLLSWLDEDRDQAGLKYKAIQTRLIRFFMGRGRSDAEDLADNTIERVTFKAKEVSKDYVGDPILYFYAVAQKVFLESTRIRPPVVMPPPIDKPADIEQTYECLDRCMLKLTAGNRELVLEYYQNDKRAKIEHRKALADKLGVAQNALRIRAHRIRLTLQQCVQVCIEQQVSA